MIKNLELEKKSLEDKIEKNLEKLETEQEKSAKSECELNELKDKISKFEIEIAEKDEKMGFS